MQEVSLAVQASGAADDLHPPRSLAVDRSLELLAVFVILTGLIGLVAALMGFFHAPQLVVIAVLATWGYACCTRRRRIDVLYKPSGSHLLLLLLVALFFRVPPYNYVLGGQDEGLYVNMANYLARTGGIVPSDPVRSALHDPATSARYIQDNYESRNYLPGVYRTAEDPPQLVFQFYHLFPVWMAVFAGLFGVSATPYGLTFLALVSILFFYRLCLALTESRPAALVAGLLLAINPLHAFFSKFPVSEVPTIAFSSIGFTFLAIYWRAAEKARLRRHLFVAALAFLCLFTTRISGFLYLPLFFLLAAATLLCDTEVARRTAIHRWVIAVVGLYASSVIYGLKCSRFYSRDVYRYSLEQLFGAHRRAGVLAFALTTLLGWLGIWIASKSTRMRAILAPALVRAQSLMAPVLMLALLLASYRVYQLGFTARYAGDPYMDRWLGLVGSRWQAVKVSSLVVAAEYLSPFLFVAFLLLTLRRWREPSMGVLLSFLLFFAAVFAWIEWWVPYQPYFARYLVSEFVPYAILSVACAWALLRPGKTRMALGAVLLLSGVYGVALSVMQTGKRENQGTYESLAALATHLDEGDLLLIDDASVRGFSIPELKTPLVYTFGLRVADIGAASLADASYLSALRSSFDDIYLVSSAATPPTGFSPVDSLRFWVMAFDHLHQPPSDFVKRIDSRLYLSRLDQLAPGAHVDFRAGGLGVDWLQDGWSVPEWWGVWAVGHSATMRISRRYLVAEPPTAALKLKLTAFVSPEHPEQHVAIRVDGAEVQKLHFQYPDARDLEATIRLDSDSPQPSRPMTIEFVMPQAASPVSVGLSSDSRVIGIGLRSLELIGSAQSRD